MNKTDEMRKIEDQILRDLFESTPSYYDPQGDLPLILDKNGRQISHEEIMELCNKPISFEEIKELRNKTISHEEIMELRNYAINQVMK